MSKELNIPAFPVDTGMTQHAGMSLRDYFAAQAVQGICARVNWSYKETARVAYEIADAMMEARK